MSQQTIDLIPQRIRKRDDTLGGIMRHRNDSRRGAGKHWRSSATVLLRGNARVLPAEPHLDCPRQSEWRVAWQSSPTPHLSRDKANRFFVLS
jgi:hypothetical protein